jgi:hypothetical protein
MIPGLLQSKSSYHRVTHALKKAQRPHNRILNMKYYSFRILCPEALKIIAQTRRFNNAGKKEGLVPKSILSLIKAKPKKLYNWRNHSDPLFGRRKLTETDASWFKTTEPNHTPPRSSPRDKIILIQDNFFLWKSSTSNTFYLKKKK